LKIIKFEEKIPAFSARLSVLITVFQVFDGNSFFKLSDSILSQKNKTGELRRLYLQCSQNWSEISCTFVQHQAVIIFKNSKHNISSTLIIFLLNYCRKAILAGLFSFSDFFTFFGQKWPYSGEECGGQTLSKLQNICYFEPKLVIPKKSLFKKNQSTLLYTLRSHTSCSARNKNRKKRKKKIERK
jgi:hypothetical protein